MFRVLQVQFGIVYGFSLAGCLALYTTINLLHSGEGLDIWKTCSVLGYCLLPVVGLAGTFVANIDFCSFWLFSTFLDSYLFVLKLSVLSFTFHSLIIFYVFVLAISIIISLKGFLGFILGIGVMVWCSYSATRLLESKLNLTEQKWLVAYPVALFYSCFILITVF